LCRTEGIVKQRGAKERKNFEERRVYNRKLSA
jgi:hypothetical protein